MSLSKIVIDKARMFIVKQRINELERSINHWPNSDRLYARQQELEDLKEQLREYEVGYEN